VSNEGENYTQGDLHVGLPSGFNFGFMWASKKFGNFSGIFLDSI